MIKDIFVLGSGSMFATRIKHDPALIILSGIIGYLGLFGTPRLATLILAVPIFWSVAGQRVDKNTYLPERQLLELHARKKKHIRLKCK